MTIQECAEAIARQQLHVDVLGMSNLAHLSPAEKIAELATYEVEKARLDVLREQLLSLMHEQITHDAMQAQSNADLKEIDRLYRLH